MMADRAVHLHGLDYELYSTPYSSFFVWIRVNGCGRSRCACTCKLVSWFANACMNVCVHVHVHKSAGACMSRDLLSRHARK
jgi:hypothetical protein